jgi:FkbM family methyltransferase
MTTEINHSLYSWYFLKSVGKFVLKPQGWKTQISKIKLNFELLRVAAKPRYQQMVIKLFGKKFELGDSGSFVWTYSEIFGTESYKFKADNSAPLIIDCGANIGLSILYFKQIYPLSRIIAFEPDSQIFSILQRNVQNLDSSGIQLINKALWDSETVLEFASEGGDAGRLTHMDELQSKKHQVSTVRLRDYLQEPVDFLKIDIEGAETTVLKDCADLLCNVKHLFVEYHSFINETQSLNTLLNILSEAGFRVYINTISTSPQPLFQRHVSNGMDMQLNICAWR